jgi:hypothetical protein
MQHGKLLVKFCEYIQVNYDGFVFWGVNLFLAVRAHVNCGAVVHRLILNQQSIPDPSLSLFDALANQTTWHRYKTGSYLSIIYFDLHLQHG